MSYKGKQLNIIDTDSNGYTYTTFPGEELTSEVMDLMTKNLSEPYPIFTYRYFLDSFPDLCIMVFDKDIFIGGIIGSTEVTSKKKTKGYIAMIAIKDEYRGKKIARHIVNLFIKRIINHYKLNEIFIETEIDNYAALHLYESVGFKRVRLTPNYYLNGNSAYKLKLWLPSEENKEIVKKLN